MIKPKYSIRATLVVIACAVCITLMYRLEDSSNNPNHCAASTIPPDTTDFIPEFIGKPASEGLIEALEYHDVHHPEIVYAQALLETGHFKSKGCLAHNNLFGLYNSKANRYCRFSHWTESVIAYKEWIQRRYRPPEDYYKFLERIGYASDPQYITKLKQLVNKNNDKRRNAERDSLSRRV